MSVLRYVLFSIVVISVMPMLASAATPCHQISTLSQVFQGFGAPFDVLNSAGTMLIETHCDLGSVEMVVGTNDPNQYIYELGYRWDGAEWQQFELTGAQKTGVWVIEQASTMLTVPQTEIEQGGYVVAFMCIRDGFNWKCGCRDQACLTPSWQIQNFQQSPPPPSSGSSSGSGVEVIRPMQGDLEELILDLDTPWDMAFLPDGTMLITERKGTVVHVDKNGAKTVTTIDGVFERTESGLHGIVLDPNFSQNNYVYIYYRHTAGSNRVERYTLSRNELTQPTLILTGIPASSIHDGGRIRFGPDGYLYIATGDAGNVGLSQDQNSLGGKILRVTDQGAPAPGNPFGNEVYSMGHRNPQGLDWDASGNLWAAEHGQSSCDEVNLIQPGVNYGWPDIECSQASAGLQPPAATSGNGHTWAPSGVAVQNGSVFVAGLRGSSLYEFEIQGTSLGPEQRHFRSQFGRIRGVSAGPDGMLYISTSNHDGRGQPTAGDDKIIRIDPDVHFN